MSARDGAPYGAGARRGSRGGILRRAVLAVALVLVAAAQFTQAQGAFDTRFESVWRLVDERYWNLDVVPADWDEVRERYAPLVAAATNEDAYFDLMEQMYDELADDHSVFVRPSRVAEIRDLYGDMPCLAFLGQAELPERFGIVGYGLVDLPGGGRAGVVALPDLASDTIAADLRRAVERLAADGAEGFVLDVRGNPGGRLVTMMQAAGVFTTGFLWRMVTTWSLPLPYPALGTPATGLPLAILIDGNVHSAAEGLAGALRQSGRAVTIGSATAGNVEALLPFCLRDGSQAWVASGVLAPIGAPTWQGDGVQPDIEVADGDALATALDWLRRELTRD